MPYTIANRNTTIIWLASSKDNFHGNMARHLKSLPLKDDSKGHHNNEKEEKKEHSSTRGLVVQSKEEPRRRRGNVIAPLHRSLLYVAAAFLFQSIAFLRKTNLHISPLRPTQPSVSRLPVLYLHVGPKKTASTTLQTKVLANKTIREALALDNITVSANFNYVKVQRLRDHCLIQPEKCRPAILDRFLREMADATDSIKSCETYSNLPRNNFTFRVFRALTERSHVKVILVYRRFSAWLPSSYYQERKGDMYYKPQHSLLYEYATYKKKTLEQPVGLLNLPQYFDHIVANHFYGDSLSTYNYFVSIYGPRNVMVVEMDAKDGIVADFLCRAIQAPHACALIKSSDVGIANDNSQFLFDQDLLVVEAFHRGLLPSTPDEHPFVDRHEATLLVQQMLKRHNMTTRHLPQVCLSQRQEEILWNRTRLMEQRLARQPRLDALREAFDRDRVKFCSLDTAAVLDNSTLRDFFFGNRCAFIPENRRAQEGCEKATA
eukprot:scaffold15555_cov180-Amphora_coffeaeformis.AAC.4